MQVLARILTALLSLVMIASGSMIMFQAPDVLRQLAIVPADNFGLSNLRGLLGGAQMSFGLLLGLAAYLGKKELLYAPMLYWLMILVGRGVGFATDGPDAVALRACAMAGGLLLLKLAILAAQR